MTTSEILNMALQVADAGGTPGDKAQITIGPRWLLGTVAGESATLGIAIDVDPNVETDADGRGFVTMSGEGRDIDAAALDLLPTIYRAEEAIRVRTAKRSERAAETLRALDAATGRNSR